MKQKVKIILILLLLLFPIVAYAQDVEESVPPNIGFSLDLFGPIFGIYSLGVSTFMNSRIQIGLYGTYYNTRGLDPNVIGWQTQVRMNYFFSPLSKNGFYLGLFGGFESVQVQNGTGYNSYNDPIGGIVPGYRWALTRRLQMLLGLIVGYMYEEVQYTPELSFIYVF